MFQLKKCFNAPINDILSNEARIGVDGKAGEYQRVVEDLILYDAETVQNLKDILLAVPSLSEEVNNQLRSKLEASACCKFCRAPRLPLSVFLSLNWLPDPMQKTDDPAKF